MHSRFRSAVAVFALLTSCTVPVRQRSFSTTPSSLNRSAKYLKAHLENGDLYVLTDWAVDAAETKVTGTGDHYDANRRVITRGAVTVPIDSVTLFETNVISRSKRVAALAIMTGVTAAVTAVCATSPKTCFGSCPTFYVADGDKWSLQAEGFSASIIPALEETDLDALYRVKPSGETFALRMTNEALETHVVRSVRLVAAPRAPNTRVFATADRQFWQSSHVASPVKCNAVEGDCAGKLSEFDGIERFSVADARDLARRETIDLQFEPPSGDGPIGVVIAARQTLMSTFLLYQALAYLGTRASDVLASLDNDAARVPRRAGGIAERLGGIDVVGSDGKTLATFRETGPLATDARLLPIPRDAARSGRLRIKLTRGLWRLDYVGLARMDKRVEPVVILPLEEQGTLTTLPGDVHEFLFKIPRPGEHELFLESRGYYLEWMRDEWVREESRLRAAMMFYTPGLALRVLAPQFKAIEPHIESQFWNSRYATH